MDDYLPISKINTVVFCPRRYFIEAVLGDPAQNVHLVEGDNLHARARREGANSWVWSDRLKICGLVDQLALEEGQPVVVEFKKGWLGDHASDQAQLAAEVLCLIEMGRSAARYGYLYYHATRRRLRVELTPQLEAIVAEAVTTMRIISGHTHYPPPTLQASKCRGCSVREACQPTLARGR